MAKEKKDGCKNTASKVKKGCKRKKDEKDGVFYVCKSCKQVTQDPESLCRPKEIAPVFVCKKCGSLSVTEKTLCKPKPL